MAQPPLLRELIEIKPTISQSDFVLTLSDAVKGEGAVQAVQEYVPTERLLVNFDEALGLIKSALEGQTSKPAYLHGSFGAGKSHFMAVLYALLAEGTEANAAVRARGEFDPLLAKHEWLRTDGKKFLMVSYHMIGAKALEQRVLGGYVDHIRKLHPDAPIPPVYRTAAMFTNIQQLRDSMGEEAVLNALNALYRDDEDEWGDSAFWTSELLDTALSAPEFYDSGDPAAKPKPLDLINPSSAQDFRAKLVNDAAQTILRGYTQHAAEDEHGFVSLDAGLSVIAAHAKSLGYDGLILFLDELILWLAGLIHDERFVSREASKITNFKEGGDTRRAIPIISFIARQRDLRELVGEELSGAAEASIQDTLNLASGRFDVITLEDRNLPQVAHARLLQPKNDEARTLIDAAFERTKKLGPQIWDTLLGSDKNTTGADEASFRLSYPFSPAFLDTLVHISAALQRSRTGLKLMGQLLADRRDSLRLGELVPLGDLYPQLAKGGDRPFVSDKKVLFDAADKLYKTKLRPYLLDSYEITEDDVRRYLHAPESLDDVAQRNRCKQFVGDDRLICTLLLAALAPSVPALRDLTIRRLGALNHGSVTTPIPGAEVGVIKSKVDDWAARFPEIKPTGTESNPAVRLELSGVDVESVIANAQVNDNPANRSALARTLLAQELGVESRLGSCELRFVWRGSTRESEVVFGNVCDEDSLPDYEFKPSLENLWRIVVDLPYDENDRPPIEDVNRIRALRERQGGNRSQTIAWLPTHLAKSRWDDFRRLVVIEKALADDHRFETQYAQHLNPDNRAAAKQLLQSQRETLRKQVKAAFKQAYGLADKKSGDVTTDLDRHLHALPEIDNLTVPIGQSMYEAIRAIAGKLLAHQYPDHPDLDPEGTGTAVKSADAKIVFTHVRAAAESHDGRVEVPAKDRPLMRRLAVPLGLCAQKGDAYFELSRRWPDHFKKTAQAEGETGDLSVISLRDWTNLPQPRGLEPFVANLVIAAFAEMDDRVWVQGGTPIKPAPEPGQVKDGYALRSQPLPSEQDWDTAGDRFAAIFGGAAPTLRRGRLVHQFADQIPTACRQYRETAAELVRQLEKHAVFLGLDDTDPAGRLALAHRSLELLGALEGASGANAAKRTIESFARFDLAEVGPQRYGASIKQAKAVAAALAATDWDTLDLARGLGPDGETLLNSLRNVARSDQFTSDLIAALTQTRQQITALIKARQRQQPAPPEPAPAPKLERAEQVRLSDDGDERDGAPSPGPRASRRSGERRTRAADAVNELSRELDELASREPNATVVITWRVIE